MRWMLVWAMMMALPAADQARADADRAYAEGLVAYDQALAEDAVGHSGEARRYLISAQTWLANAAAKLEALRIGTNDPDIAKSLIEVKAVGKACCGRTSLWDRYGLTTSKADTASRQ